MKLKMINKKILSGFAFLALMAVISAPAFAATASGTVAMSATTTGTLNMTFVTDASGIAVGGTGTSAATIAFGTVQAFGGSLPTGVTRSVNGTTNWTLSTPFDVEVDKSNLASATYTLDASLNAADATNAWALGATVLTATPAAMTATGVYGSTAYTLNLTIPFSETAGLISNNINFTATSN